MDDQGVVEGVVEEGLRYATGAFNVCRNMTKASIPDGVRKICGSAFLFCVKFTDVTIAPTVKSIGPFAFKGTALTEVCISRKAM